MRDHEERFRSLGMTVAVVSQGTPEELSRFLENRKLPFEIYADPGRKAYAIYGLERGGAYQVVFSPEVLAAGVKAFAEGHVVTRAVGDTMQLPGSFVVSGGRITYAHRGKLSSDTAPIEELLSVGGTSESS